MFCVLHTEAFFNNKDFFILMGFSIILMYAGCSTHKVSMFSPCFFQKHKGSYIIDPIFLFSKQYSWRHLLTLLCWLFRKSACLVWTPASISKIKPRGKMWSKYWLVPFAMFIISNFICFKKTMAQPWYHKSNRCICIGNSLFLTLVCNSSSC